MNKTISINLGGMVFNIEEEAYNILRVYLDRIQQNFINDKAATEIMADIEGRIAELFQERNTDRKNVVAAEDVEQVIAIMGRPEDYVSEDSDATNKTSSTSSNTHSSSSSRTNSRRRIFRDTDDAVLGGVCSGLSHYFGCDPIVIRLIMVVLAFVSFGTAIFGYILFWALVPAAWTTAEKLQMRGEPVNVDNISRFVNDEAKSAAEKVGKFGRRVGDNVRAASGTVAHGLGRVLSVCFGLLFLFFGIILLISLVFFLGFSEYQFFGFDGNNWEMLDSIIFANDGTLWVLVLGIVLVMIAPALGLIYTAVKLITATNKRIKGFGVTLISLFIIGIVLCTYGGVHTTKQFVHDGKISSEITLTNVSSDTLVFDVLPDDVFIGRNHRNDEFPQLIKKQGDKIYYGRPIDVDFRPTKETKFSVEIEKKSNGKNIGEAGNFARNISYDHELRNDSLIFPAYFTTPATDAYRMQRMDITVFVPEGKYVRFGNNAELITWFRNPEEPNKLLRMGKDGLVEVEDYEEELRSDSVVIKGELTIH